MKFTKMSLVAALLIGSSAFAIENTKVSGDLNVYYMTSDADNAGYNAVTGNSGSLFSADSSAADIGLNLNITTDLAKNDLLSISAGAGITALTTLGLENNLVGNVWGGAHGATVGTGAHYGNALGGAKVNDVLWLNEAWLAVTTGKTTAKIGRMALDTPLAFTETWSIEKNTFEAVVLINQDIPDTTLVGAYVGNGNGSETFGQTNLNSNINPVAQDISLTVAPVVNEGGTFGTFGSDGAYAVGAINNSFKPLTVQAWYYAVKRVANAYWLQADLNMDGILAGLQYTDVKSVATGAKSDNVYAVMLGYEMKDTFTARASYSQVNDNGSIGYAGFNTATAVGSAQSKLYTEAWWNYGKVTQTDTSSYNVTITSPVNGIVDLGLYYTNADQSTAKGDNDLSEVTLSASKSFGPLDASLVYVNTDVKDNTKDSNAVQVYLTVNF